MGQPPDAMNIFKIQQNHLTRLSFRKCSGDGLYTFIYQFSDIHLSVFDNCRKEVGH